MQFSPNYIASLYNRKQVHSLQNVQQYTLWRSVYEGGSEFVAKHLKKFSDRESDTEFQTRIDLTPIPAYAKREINKVKNGLFRRFADILRRGGSEKLQNAIAGNGRGVDNKGSSMDTFLGVSVLPELLSMGKVGVLIDAPPFTGSTLLEQPEGFSPYVYTYTVEQIARAIPSAPGSVSDWQAVLLSEYLPVVDPSTLSETYESRYRLYQIDERGKVSVSFLDVNGDVQGVVPTDLDAIPFVLFDIGESLLKDAAQYQVALLNMMSSDTLYAITANFPFLTRQRGNTNLGEHLKGAEAEVTVGVQKGLYYDKNMERPGFISPPTTPLEVSIALRDKMKEEVAELVSGQIKDLGDDDSIESGLAFIGLVLEQCENRCWDHWTAYEQIDPSRRQKPTIRYPDYWSIKSESERIDEAKALADTMYAVPGRLVKKEIAKLVADKLLRGRVSTEVLEDIREEIDNVEYCTSDPKIIIEAKKNGAMSGLTATLALGGTEGEWERAKQDQADRVAAIVAAQSDASASRGNPDGSVDPESAKLEREGDSDNPAKMTESAGVRGESDDIEGE